MVRYRNVFEDLYRDFELLQREMNRALEETGLGRWTSPYSRFSFLPGTAARVYPLVNISEDNNNVYVEALAPGVDAESLDVSVLRDQLTLSGEKRTVNNGVKREDYHRNERAAGKFVRTVELPAPVNADKVKAEYRNGILLVTLPKSEAAKPKKITVQA